MDERMFLLEDKRFYVYVYLDPRKPGNYCYGEHKFDYEPFYVGMGHKDRKFAHLKEAEKSNKNSKRLNKIRKLKKQGLTPIILEAKSNLTKSNALELETFIIQKIGREINKSGPLLNFYDKVNSIDGLIIRESNKRMKLLGVKRTLEQKRRMSEASKGKKKSLKHIQSLTGKKRSEESRQKMSVAQKRRTDKRSGYKQSEEARKNMSNAQTGTTRRKWHHSEETKRKISLNHRRMQSEETKIKIKETKRRKKNEHNIGI
jgi:hypothetical protein